MDDDSALLPRLLRGDYDAYERLVREHVPRLVRVAERILRDGPDAEDAVQEALISAWRSVRQFDGQARFSTWLHRITVNSALTVRRRRTRRPLEVTTEMAHVPHEEHERAQWVWRAMDALPEELRTVVILRDVEELPSKEVAALLGISDVLVRQRLHRARRQLAAQLQPDLIGEEPLKCGGDVDLLFDSVDETLQPELAAPVAAHIGGCAACQLTRDGFAALAAAARQHEPPVSEERAAALVAAVVSRLATPHA